MRYFDLLNFQHVILYVFPTLLFMLIFFLALGYHHFHTQQSEKRKTEIIHRFPENIDDRNSPFPLVMLLIIIGTALWAFFYTLAIGLMDIRI